MSRMPTTHLCLLEAKYIFNEQEQANFFILTSKATLSRAVVIFDGRAPTMKRGVHVIKNMIVYSICHRYVDGGLQYCDAVKHTSQQYNM